MPIKQLRENLCLHLALGQLLVAFLVRRIVFCVGINRRHKHDVFAVRRPNAAVRSRGNVRDLLRLAVEPAAFRSEVAYPDLGWVGGL
jgi:hypothetical protein